MRVAGRSNPSRRVPISFPRGYETMNADGERHPKKAQAFIYGTLVYLHRSGAVTTSQMVSWISFRSAGEISITFWKGG